MSSSLIKTNETSFSPRNLLYMHQFYRLFPDAGSSYNNDSVPTEQAIAKQLVSQISPGDEVFQIPWGHIIQIMNKGSLPTVEELETELAEPDGGQDSADRLSQER